MAFSEVIDNYVANMQVGGLDCDRFRLVDIAKAGIVRSEGKIILGDECVVEPVLATIDGVTEEVGKRLKPTGNLLNLGFSSKNPPRLIISAPPGGGKTVMAYNIMYQLVKRFGYSVIVLIDPKNEMRIMKNNGKIKKAISEDLGDMKCKVYVPRFLKSEAKGRVEIEISANDFEHDELAAMYSSEDTPEGVMNAIEGACSLAKETFGKKYTIENLLESLQNVRHVDKRSVTSATNRIISLKRRGVISDKTNFDIIKDMKDGFVPIIQYDMKIERKGNRPATENFVSYLLRKIESAAVMEKGLKFCPILDETRIISPPKREPPSKESLKNYFGIMRGLGGAIIMTTLSLGEVDQEIMKRATNIIAIGKLSSDEQVLRKLMPSYQERVVEMNDVLNTEDRTAALININSGEVLYFVSRAGEVIPEGSS